MAFTYALIKVTSLAVNDQVVMAAAADGHCYVYPTPTTSGAKYPVVAAIFTAPLPPGDTTTGDSLTTVQIDTGNPFSKPADWTINGNTDWVVRATGTA